MLEPCPGGSGLGGSSGGLRAGGALRASAESCKMESLAGAGRAGHGQPPGSPRSPRRAMPPHEHRSSAPPPKASAVPPGFGWGLAGPFGKWRMGRDKMESG